MPGRPSVEERCERLAQRDELIEALSGELGAARVRIADTAEVVARADLRPSLNRLDQVCQAYRFAVGC